MNAYQPRKGVKCSCRRGIERDNCPACEGTGWAIDFAAVRNAPKVKRYAVVAVSDNRNAFGLKGVVMVALDGEAWEGAKSSPPAVGEILEIPVNRGYTELGQAGYELPRRLEDAPHEIVSEAWKAEVTKDDRFKYQPKSGWRS